MSVKRIKFKNLNGFGDEFTSSPETSPAVHCLNLRAEGDALKDGFCISAATFTGGRKLYLPEDVAKDAVGLGSTVTLLDVEYNEEVVYKIVGSTEVDSLNGKISNESPVGKALIGAKKGATIGVDTPAGVIKYKITKVEKPASAKGAKKTTKKKA